MKDTKNKREGRSRNPFIKYFLAILGIIFAGIWLSGGVGQAFCFLGIIAGFLLGVLLLWFILKKIFHSIKTRRLAKAKLQGAKK